jgi:raffinose/stachyose/melibiose transport system substrate-binding protein
MFRRIGLLVMAVALVATAFPAGALAQAPVTLTFWSWRTEDKAAYDRMIRVFEQKNPGIKVEFVPFRQTEYNTILSSGLTAGKASDIIHLRAYGGLETFAAPGYLAPLDYNMVPELKRFPLQTMVGARSRRDGKIYGVPFATQTLVIYYNKKIFQQNGLSVPKTWEGFMNLMKTLRERGITPLANGAKEGWTLEVLSGVIAPNFYGGTTFFEAVTRGQTTFRDPMYTNALAKLLDLRPYMPQGFMGVDYATMQQLFLNEQAAMFIGGSWEIGFFKAQNKNLDFGVFAAPAERADQIPWVSSFADGNYGINAKTPHLAEAIKFIRFTATTEFGQMFTDLLAQMSAVPGVVIKDPNLQAVQAMNRKATPYIMLVGFRWQAPTGSTLLQSSLQALLAGQMTPVQVGDELTRGLSSWVDSFRR